MNNNEKHENFMKIALEEARKSLSEGNKGFGAVIIKNGELISKARDKEVTHQDPTAHAELLALRKASESLGRDFSGCSLYTTHEPCPMCITAILWAKIPSLIFSISIEEALKLGRKRINVACDEIIKRANSEVTVVRGILREECFPLYNSDVRNLVKIYAKNNPTQLKKLKTELTEKRLKWSEEHKQYIKNLQGSDVEKAYHLLLNKLDIKKSDAPIVKKCKNRLVFHSKNFCPTLEACKILSLDTRRICKKVYEKPTEKLLQSINPNIKFSRNYERIRPDHSVCEEIIEIDKN